MCFRLVEKNIQMYNYLFYTYIHCTLSGKLYENLKLLQSKVQHLSLHDSQRIPVYKPLPPSKHQKYHNSYLIAQPTHLTAVRLTLVFPFYSTV